jgi:translocation and assembly module TamB
MRAEGRFSLGYPRKDLGEELNARINATDWPLTDLRHAFDMDEYPLDGDLSGEFHLYGAYTGPFGFGRVTVAPAIAYDEHIARASAALRFDGTGAWFDGIEIRKGTGTIRGAARVEWEGTYSFNADGRGIPVESIDVLTFPKFPLTGIFEFSAGGSGAFLNPTYDVDARFRDLFVKDEGIGDVKGKIAMRGDDMNFSFEAGSARLQASGTGKVTLLGDYPGDITLQVSDTSLDPYARLFSERLSPFASAVASGTVKIGGTLANIDGLVASARVEKLELRLFDYALTNSRPVDIGFAQDVLRIRPVGCTPRAASGECWVLTGEDTRLGLSGDIDLKHETIDIHADGAANLGILQAFSHDLRGDGRADVVADITGSFERPQVAGSARIVGGRLRHLWVPHAIENINGRIAFAGSSIRLDDVTATMAKGKVAFGGRVALQGLWPSQFDVTASGDAMELRYPTGFRSVVDADLALRGTPADPVLSGTVTVRNALMRRTLDFNASLVELAGAAGVASGAAAAAPPGASAELPFPLRFDLRIIAPPSTLEINSKDVRISANADLTLRGTYDKPALLGRAEVERGELWYEGRRIVVTRGTIEFTNPSKIDPYFDVEAETRVRAPGQTYQITLRATGTMQRFTRDLSSDPPLPEVDVVTLLLGDVQSMQDPELRALQQPDAAERTLLQSQVARLVTNPISSNVQKAVTQTFGVETFQLTPMIVDPSQTSTKFSPGARLTIGKRISDRVYLTYSQSLRSSSGDQVILLEYDQSDRLSWVLTRNEDKTYALDVRVRHVFK